MSTFENNEYRWRETYFVLFPAGKRPKLKKVEKAVASLDEHYELVHGNADPQGRFESLTVLAPDDFAALDISYVEGDEVTEQAAELAKELATPDCQAADRARLERLRRCDGRFDVLHFEQVIAADEDDSEGMLDPSTLLVVLEALAKLTDGVAVDPQSGTFM